jgi:hypothetical protein
MLILVHDVPCVLMCHPVPQGQTMNAQYQKSFLQYHLYHLVQEKHQNKGKVHPTTSHESKEREYMYRATKSFTSALEGDGWSMPCLSHFTPPETSSTHCTHCPDGQGFDSHTMQPVASH